MESVNGRFERPSAGELHLVRHPLAHEARRILDGIGPVHLFQPHPVVAPLEPEDNFLPSGHPIQRRMVLSTLAFFLIVVAGALVGAMLGA